MAGKLQGNGAPGASNEGGEGGEGDEPQYMTADEFNAAFTKRAKELEGRFTKLVAGLETKLGEVATTLGTTLDEKLASLAPKTGTEQQGQAGAKPEDSPVFKGLQKQLDDLRAKNEADRAALAAEKAKARANDLRTQTLALLEQQGFTDASRARKALTLLIAEGRVKWSGEKEDGDELVFIGEDREAVDIETGLKSYAKSEDAKIFLPPKGVAGAGSRPGGAGTKPGEKSSAGSLLSQLFDEQ